MVAKQESGKPLGPALSSLYLVASCWLPLDCTAAFGSQAELSAGGGSSCTRLCAPRGVGHLSRKCPLPHSSLYLVEDVGGGVRGLCTSCGGLLGDSTVGPWLGSPLRLRHKYCPYSTF